MGTRVIPFRTRSGQRKRDMPWKSVCIKLKPSKLIKDVPFLAELREIAHQERRDGPANYACKTITGMSFQFRAHKTPRGKFTIPPKIPPTARPSSTQVPYP